MRKIRRIKKVLKSRATLDGAGVRLRRVFSNSETDLTDPFLLLDFFGSDNPDDYIAGFPWHPHRGIETITYMLKGQVKHEDSLGNSGIIDSGDCQWMTAGSGIIHQEMPGRVDGAMMGFQLWANLPSSHKMMHPRYRDISESDIPEVKTDDGVIAKIIAGKFRGVSGPVREIVTEPEYLDIFVPANTELRYRTRKEHTAFAYIFEGQGIFSNETTVESDRLVIFDRGDEIIISTTDYPIRFLLISGKPIGEPIAWYGPIVMNTREELEEAFREYREGSFIKHK
ncbi:pirin family protein [Candidatus Thorarchaeota archaeon]|nr:MAG: pirin family protein [Candidatus Thorarchaeota archaeon]